MDVIGAPGPTATAGPGGRRGARAQRRKRAAGFAFLSRSPLIVYAFDERPLRVALWFGLRHPGERATFLMQVSWTMELASAAGKLARHFARHRARFPGHELIALANTAREQTILAAAGARSIFLNQNIMLSEATYRPLPGAAVEFDAIYNARLEPFKRHELAREIPSVGYLGYWFGGSAEHRRSTLARADLIRSFGPRHRILNPLVGGLPRALPDRAVNAAYARAAVGLCLSASEGAMYAAVEYLLAGLPVVSTPSLGGRDAFFDPEFCRIVPADPRAVRDGVEALRAQNIPREHIRQRTLERMAEQRAAFLDLLNAVLESHERKPRFGPEWPYLGQSKLLRWRRLERHFRGFEALRAIERMR